MVNKWTRDDLPSISDLCQADDERGNGERTVTLDIALDAVVDRLNKDFPKSYDRGGLRGSTWLERERDMWRNSYGIAAVRLEQARECAEKAERDRDEAVARADAAIRPEVTRNDVHNAPRGGRMTRVYRAYSPSRDKAGTTYADRARAVSQAAVRNQFVACDPNTAQLADWTVQTGHVQWEQA